MSKENGSMQKEHRNRMQKQPEEATTTTKAAAKFILRQG